MIALHHHRQRAHQLALTAFLSVALVLLVAPAGFSGTSGGGHPTTAWTKIADESSGWIDTMNSVCVLNDGDLVAAGQAGESGGGSEIIVRKYRSSDGSTQWTKHVTGDGGAAPNIGMSAAACKDGNVVVAGYVYMTASSYDIWVRKLSAEDGSTIWNKRYSTPGSRIDMGFAVCVDIDGNELVAGMISDATGLQHSWVRKYSDADGSTIWTRTFPGGTFDDAMSVAVGDDGNPVVVGRVTSSDGIDMRWWVAKLRGADGTTIWSRNMLSDSNDSNAFGVAVDAAGDAVVTGDSYSGINHRVFTRKYGGADGTTIWSKSFASGEGQGDTGFAVAVDPAGNPFVAGAVATSFTDTKVWLRQYDGATGDTLWTDTYHDGTGWNEGRGVTVDWAGNLYVAGTVGLHTGDSFVRKYYSGNVYTHPAWYLAEGSTAWGFSCEIAIENPNATTVTARVSYMTSTGPVPGGDLTLPPMSQTMVNPQDTLGARDFSTKVVCLEGKTIAVDRTMSWTGPGAPSPEAHNSIGVTAPATTWYLPEGSSAWGFECWLLIQNPNPAAAECNVTYMIEGGSPVTVSKTVPANSRRSFNMADDIGSRDASIKVECALPVIPERAMYRNNRREGHDSIGTTAPASDFYLAEGTTAWGFTTYVLVQNPNEVPADVTLTYMTPSGPRTQPAFTMPARSRRTIRVNDVLPDTDLSTKVHGSVPIIAERSMYWGAGTALGEACHDSVGMSSPHKTFYLPDGYVSDTSTSGAHQTWTLVQNPNDTEVDVKVSYLKYGGGEISFTDSIPANSRKTYNMGEKIALGGASVMVASLTPGKKIMCERAMYFVYPRGAGTDTIGGYCD